MDGCSEAPREAVTVLGSWFGQRAQRWKNGFGRRSGGGVLGVVGCIGVGAVMLLLPWIIVGLGRRRLILIMLVGVGYTSRRGLGEAVLERVLFEGEVRSSEGLRRRSGGDGEVHSCYWRLMRSLVIAVVVVGCIGGGPWYGVGGVGMVGG